MSTKNPLLSSAACLVKGAICYLLKIDHSKTTRSIRFKEHVVSMSIGPLNGKKFDETYLEDLRNILHSKIIENLPFYVFEMHRSEAEAMYKEAYLDYKTIPSEIQILRLVILPSWYINANCSPVLRDTSSIGRIDVISAMVDASNDTLELEFSVYNPKYMDISGEFIIDNTLLATEYKLEDLASNRFIPPPLSDILSLTQECDIEASSIVDPWNVKTQDLSGIDYNKLIQQFGCKHITDDLIAKIEKITNKKAHHFLRRKIFLSHRDLDQVLNAYEAGKLFYLYTGRGPSSEALHIGHLIPLLFTKYLQDVFKVPLVIQLTDDEKFLFKEDLSLENAHKYAYENAKDIIACGFDPELTFIFTNLDYIKTLYPEILKIQKKFSCSQSRSIFGFTNSDNVGKYSFPAVQAAPSFSSAFPTIFGGRTDIWCLSPHAIDQDPYFRMMRDIGPRLGYLKPASIHSKFIPSLQGQQMKMSGSIMNSSIFVTDDEDTIKMKIMKYAFSGGRATESEQRRLGADLSVDVPWQYLQFLIEDDALLEDIGRKYSSGEMLSGEIKMILVEELVKMTKMHQQNRANISDEVLKYFMDPDRESFKKYMSQLC
ncbi:tryptophanyl-tRNA synthetase family protein [Cryptosporidium andersoni]|uniref:Tryptophan--tRNA ligase, cytoplasmic n=1 Tax=Cryptosporidium andersoni TaxID=117008 RepID=A0A1J4MNU6_9CRYT|nr:tryptophanyl-tRNA synthetase family protein [Cryptosporidium andersoni]